MQRHVDKFGISDKRGRVRTSSDPYLPEAGEKEPALCSGCGALYRNKRWTLAAEAREAAGEAVLTVCPACRRGEDGYPEGIVTLSGPYLREHHQEIVNLLRNEEAKALAKNPLERILRLEQEGEGLVIETARRKLAEHLGRAVHKAHQGDLQVSWAAGHTLCRVRWERLH